MNNKNIEHFLKKVERPGQYIGGEFNSVVKDHSKVKTTFAFAFPDTYDIGMSYMGMQILYNIINKCDDLVCERTYAPAKDMEALMRQESLPLFTLETKKPVKDYDIFGFTLQYEMAFTNILNMIDLAGMPLRTEDRKGGDYPIIVAGGPCAFNPEPLAPFIDVFLIGDGEELLPAFLRLHAECSSREEFLERACQLEGVYVPEFYDFKYKEDGTIEEIVKLNDKAPDTVKKAMVEDLNSVEYPRQPLVPIVDIVQDRSVVEVFRGCTRGCRFCQAGMIYRPVRERDCDKLLDIAKDLIINTGYDEMTLLSLSTSDYSELRKLILSLMDVCKEKDVALSLPSLRLDNFIFDVLQEIQKVRKTGLTFAAEAGTQRLRNVINKNITEEDIYGSTRQAIELGWQHIKLYFMMGLPCEEYSDLDGIAEIARNIMNINREVRGKAGGRFSITVSVSNFVPKAHTPFQWHPQDEDFTDKHNYLTDRLKIKGVKFAYHDSPVSRLEAIFARGDRRTGDLLEFAYKRGCTFDAWSEHFNLEQWNEARKDWNSKYGLDIDSYRTRQRSFDEILPWDLIDSGVTKKFLQKEMEKAMIEATTPDCRHNCNNCGINQRTKCEWGGIYG